MGLPWGYFHWFNILQRFEGFSWLLFEIIYHYGKFLDAHTHQYYKDYVFLRFIMELLSLRLNISYHNTTPDIFHM